MSYVPPLTAQSDCLNQDVIHEVGLLPYYPDWELPTVPPPYGIPGTHEKVRNPSFSDGVLFKVTGLVEFHGRFTLEEMTYEARQLFNGIRGRYQCGYHSKTHHRTYYYPLHPETDLSHYTDIIGLERVKYEGHEYWAPVQETPKEHAQHQAMVLACLGGVFQPLFAQYQVDLFSAANDAARLLAQTRYAATAKFYGAVVQRVKDHAATLTFGHRSRQEPAATVWHEASAAVAAVKAAWTEDAEKRPDLGHVSVRWIENTLNVPTPRQPWVPAPTQE